MVGSGSSSPSQNRPENKTKLTGFPLTKINSIFLLVRTFVKICKCMFTGREKEEIGFCSILGFTVCVETASNNKTLPLFP